MTDSLLHPKGRRVGLLPVRSESEDLPSHIASPLAQYLREQAHGEIDPSFVKATAHGLYIELNGGARLMLSPYVGHNDNTGQSVITTPDLIQDLLDRQDLPPNIRHAIETTREGQDGLCRFAGATIQSFNDIPLLVNLNIPPPEYLEDPIVPECALSAFTGPSGHGKTTLLCALGARIAKRGIRVLCLDRDNPISVVAERFNRLGIIDGPNLCIWGGWCRDEPPDLDSPLLLSWAATCEPKPWIIVDCLGSFFTGDENSAADMRQLVRPLRRLVDAGAAVSLLHNDGKADGAKDYRGSAAFKDAVDVAFHVSNSNPNGPLEKLTLRCFKSRFGFSGEIVYDYADGQLIRSDAAVGPKNSGHSEQLHALLVEHPGLGNRQFEALAAQNRIPQKLVRVFLRDGVASGRIRRDGKRNTGFRHYAM